MTIDVMDNYFFGLPPITKQRVGLKLFYSLQHILTYAIRKYKVS